MGFTLAAVSQAQEKDVRSPEFKPAAQGTQGDPLRRRPEKRRMKAIVRTELSETYRKWLNTDVCWIITDEEKSAFMQLVNDEERDHFVEAFWQRRIFGSTWLH